MDNGEHAEAVRWCERAARLPGAHVMIAMVASVAQWLAGNETQARDWARNVSERNPRLTLEDFLAAFPLRPPEVRSQVSAALRQLGF